MCGPTWPVSDVRDALEKAIAFKGRSAKEAKAYLEQMKEDGRYILEVY